MMVNEAYQFTASVSKDIYVNKLQTTAAINSREEGRKARKECGLKDKLCFKEQTVTPSSLLGLALEGHTFCHLFGNFTSPPPKTTYLRKDGYFTMGGKCGQFFQGSYFIGVDIDNTKYTPQEFADRLRLKPTLWYTSLSHLQKDKNGDGQLDSRFRLIYVFDSLIQDKYYFRYCASKLYKMIEEDTQEEIEDKCGLSCCQYFNGTYIHSDGIKSDYGLTNLIYSLDDIQVSSVGYLNYLRNNCEYKTLDKSKRKEIKDRILTLLSQSDFGQTNHQENTHLISEWNKNGRSDDEEDIDLDQQMINDYRRLPWDEFFSIYRYEYSLVYRTEREDWLTLDLGDKAIKYQFCDDDYLELSWIGNITANGNQTKRKDGQHRRSTLFHRGWLRRVIKPSITPSELLFNLICDVERFLDNSDGVLDVDTLVTKVRQCFSLGIEDNIKEYPNIYNETKEKCRRKRFIIHWTSRKDIKPNSLSKELRWQLLDILYDRELTLMENLQILLDSDIAEFDKGLSRNSLYRYCKDRGIVCSTKSLNKREMFFKLHVDGMSLPKEQEYLKEKGLALSMTTISKYRGELEAMSLPTVIAA